jgi:hypothetical protein
LTRVNQLESRFVGPHAQPAAARAAGLLKPLGHPSANGVKFFAAAEVRELKTDRKWLARATDAVHEHWRHKNQRPLLRAPQTSAGSRAKPTALETTRV